MISYEDLAENKKGSLFKRVDDKKVVLDLSAVSWIEVGISMGLILLGLYFLISPITDYYESIEIHQEIVDNERYSLTKHKLYSNSLEIAYEREGLEALKEAAFGLYFASPWPITVIYFLFNLFPLVMGLYWLNSSVKRFRDQLTFDREKGTVSYRHFFGLCTHTVPFEETLFQSLPAGLIRKPTYYLVLRFPNSNNYAEISVYPYLCTSFYVWYMDKNRPLPPSEVLNPYREADYLRRRNNDFPEPLYASGISTPEWEGAMEKYKDYDGNKRSRLYLDKKIQLMVNNEPPWAMIRPK